MPSLYRHMRLVCGLSAVWCGKTSCSSSACDLAASPCSCPQTLGSRKEPARTNVRRAARSEMFTWHWYRALPTVERAQDCECFAARASSKPHITPAEA